MTEVNLREVPTASAILAEVRHGVEEIVRVALEEAANLHEEADEKLAHYDATVNEAARLRGEVFGLRRDLEGIPDRLAKAKLDQLLPDGGGEDPALLERRYVAARERLPVAEARIGKLEQELSGLVSGGSRPARIDPAGGARRLVKHKSREPILSTLNEVVQSLEALRERLPDVVEKASAPLLKERNTLRSGQNELWGLARKA